MQVKNHDYLSEAEIIEVGGSKYAVGKAASGIPTVLSGKVVATEKENHFVANEASEKEGFENMPTDAIKEKATIFDTQGN